MSADGKRKKGYETTLGPLREPPKEQDEVVMTTAQQRAQWQLVKDIHDHITQQNREQAEFFKQLFEESSLPKYVKLAGVSALLALLLEFVRMIWLIVRYTKGF
jgi:hypothetical protein